MKLTKAELEIILESLKYTKKKIEEYDGYPSYQFKQERMSEIEQVIKKVKDGIKNASD